MALSRNPYIGKSFVFKKRIGGDRFRDYCYRRQPNLIVSDDVFNVGKKLHAKEGLMFKSCPMFQDLLGKNSKSDSNENGPLIPEPLSMDKESFEEAVKKITEKKKKDNQKMKKDKLPSVEQIRNEIKKIITFHEKKEETLFASVYPLPSSLNSKSSEKNENENENENEKVVMQPKNPIHFTTPTQYRNKPIRGKDGVIQLSNTAKRKYHHNLPYPAKKRTKRGK